MIKATNLDPKEHGHGYIFQASKARHGSSFASKKSMVSSRDVMKTPSSSNSWKYKAELEWPWTKCSRITNVITINQTRTTMEVIKCKHHKTNIHEKSRHVLKSCQMVIKCIPKCALVWMLKCSKSKVQMQQENATIHCQFRYMCKSKNQGASKKGRDHSWLEKDFFMHCTKWEDGCASKSTKDNSSFLVSKSQFLIHTSFTLIWHVLSSLSLSINRVCFSLIYQAYRAIGILLKLPKKTEQKLVNRSTSSSLYLEESSPRKHPHTLLNLLQLKAKLESVWIVLPDYIVFNLQPRFGQGRTRNFSEISLYEFVRSDSLKQSPNLLCIYILNSTFNLNFRFLLFVWFLFKYSTLRANQWLLSVKLATMNKGVL